MDLYTSLTEQEANQMLALLVINRLSAKKVVEVGGIKLTISHSDFVQAVEILRQSGYPRRQYHSVNDLFPANQLVSSPAQEQTKISYLKEQRLEQLLSTMEGVVQVSVAIAINPAVQSRRDATPPSAAVLIKHSPETNMSHFVTQIKSLVHNSVPGLGYEAISVVLQPTNYRFLTSPVELTAPVRPQQKPAVPQANGSGSFTSSADAEPAGRGGVMEWVVKQRLFLLVVAAWLAIMVGFLIWRQRRLR